jgi:hypothetical protein
MFSRREWTFTGASGVEYKFSILAKSEEPPQSSGVFILAYVHPRGHLAGWQVNPLFIGQADDLRPPLAEGVGLDNEQRFIWNCNFVLLEPAASVREACVRDLEAEGARFS